MRNLIKKILKPEIIEEFLLNESLDSPLSNIKQIDDFEYEASNDFIGGRFIFSLGFNNNDLFKYGISDDIDVFYNFSWSFILDTDESLKTVGNWKKLTSTGFIILDDFIRKHKPKLIKFSFQTGGSEKVYFNEIFLSKLKSIFYHNYDVITDRGYGVVMLVDKKFSNLKEEPIKKRMEQCGETLIESENYWKYPHRRKREMRGIMKNDYIKEQIKRILNKNRYL
jgi:hypothetical protein